MEMGGLEARSRNICQQVHPAQCGKNRMAGGRPVGICGEVGDSLFASLYRLEPRPPFTRMRYKCGEYIRVCRAKYTKEGNFDASGQLVQGTSLSPSAERRFPLSY